MIEVEYLERLGNNLFQYCFGRIIAENMGYKLKAYPIPGFPNTQIEVNGEDYSSPEYPVQTIWHDFPDWEQIDYAKVFSWRNNNLDLKEIFSDKTKRKILVKGFFQRYDYYKPYKDSIRKSWLKIDKKMDKMIGSEDVAVCIRRDDYVRLGSALPASFYKDALSVLPHRKVFICADAINDPFVQSFKKKYNAEVYLGDPLDTLKFIMNFKKIIISNGTLHWWAAFLSDAEEIYAPIPLQGYGSPQHPEIDLRVDDEKRYIYIQCRYSFQESIARKIFSLKRSFHQQIKQKTQIY